MKLYFSPQIFKKSSYIKFHEYLSTESRAVPCGLTDRMKDERTDMTQQLMVAFLNFANAPKNGFSGEKKNAASQQISLSLQFTALSVRPFVLRGKSCLQNF